VGLHPDLLARGVTDEDRRWLTLDLYRLGPPRWRTQPPARHARDAVDHGGKAEDDQGEAEEYRARKLARGFRDWRTCRCGEVRLRGTSRELIVTRPPGGHSAARGLRRDARSRVMDSARDVPGSVLGSPPEPRPRPARASPVQLPSRARPGRGPREVLLPPTASRPRAATGRRLRRACTTPDGRVPGPPPQGPMAERPNSAPTCASRLPARTQGTRCSAQIATRPSTNQVRMEPRPLISIAPRSSTR